MTPVFVFPPAYHQLHPRFAFATQPFSGYSSQFVSDQIPDDRLEAYQQAFLSGEVLQPVGIFQPPKHFSIDLSEAICQRLSTRGSLKKDPTLGLARPNYQGMEPSMLTAINTAMPGYLYTLSGWMDFPGSVERNAALQEAIQTGSEHLARSKQGIWISDHVDFGLKYAGWTSSEGLYDSHEGMPQYFRTLFIVNAVQHPVGLLDICGIPSVNHIFVFHDDYGSAHHYHPRNHHNPNQKGVHSYTTNSFPISSYYCECHRTLGRLFVGCQWRHHIFFSMSTS